MKENKLRGRLGALQMTLTEFASKMGMSRPTARNKIDGVVPFNSREITKAIEVLEIPVSEAHIYFF